PPPHPPSPLPDALPISTAVVDKRARHPDLTGFARLQELHTRYIVRRNPPVRTYLHDAVVLPGRLHHRASFPDGMPDRLFDIHMRDRKSTRLNSSHVKSS